MYRALFSGALVLGLVAGGCTRHAGVGTDTVGPGYVTGGGEWNSGGGVTAVVRIFERGGVTVVCGAWTTDRQSVLSINQNDDAIEAGSVYAGKTRLAMNLAFMARVPYADNISGAQGQLCRQHGALAGGTCQDGAAPALPAPGLPGWWRRRGKRRRWKPPDFPPDPPARYCPLTQGRRSRKLQTARFAFDRRAPAPQSPGAIMGCEQ